MTRTMLPSRILRHSPAFNSSASICRSCQGALKRQVSSPSSIHQRSFTTTRPSAYKSVEAARARHRLGPFSWPAGVLFLAMGAGMLAYFRHEKDRMQRARIAAQNKGIGKPLVGGPFSLIDQHGRPFTQDDLKGKYSLLYFGFTNCPDICPEELDKMAEVIDKVKEQHGEALKPVFISCDPARDTPEIVGKYLKDFHDDIVGLTGTYDEIKQTCKNYRVYFSTPKEIKPGQDYLVDHSIYFFLMDPEVDFVEAIGRTFSVEGAARVIGEHIRDWKGPLDRATPVNPAPE